MRGRQYFRTGVVATRIESQTFSKLLDLNDTVEEVASANQTSTRLNISAFEFYLIPSSRSENFAKGCDEMYFYMWNGPFLKRQSKYREFTLKKTPSITIPVTWVVNVENIQGLFSKYEKLKRDSRESRQYMNLFLIKSPYTRNHCSFSLAPGIVGRNPSASDRSRQTFGSYV